MTLIIGHAVLFVLAGLSGYLLTTDRRDTLGFILLIVASALGLFLLHGWALLTVVAGAILGARINRKVET